MVTVRAPCADISGNRPHRKLSVHEKKCLSADRTNGGNCPKNVSFLLNHLKEHNSIMKNCKFSNVREMKKKLSYTAFQFLLDSKTKHKKPGNILFSLLAGFLTIFIYQGPFLYKSI